MSNTLRAAWSGLGKATVGALSSEDAIKQAGLDWSIDQMPLVARKRIETPEGEVIRDIDTPDYVANVRSDTGEVLGVVSPSYRVVQNVEAFSFLDELLQDGSLQYESAGYLKGGRLVYIVAKMPTVDTIAPGDTINRNILLTMAHDGTGAIRATPTACRLVCWNTISAVGKNAKQFDRHSTIRHSGNIVQKMSQARFLLSICNEQFTQHADACRHLANRTFNTGELETFLNKLFPSVDAPGRAKTIRDNDVASVRINLESPRQHVGNIGGTWWSALNAVTELIDHQSVTRGATQRDKDENRMMASIGLHGRAAAFKETALELALTMSA